MSASFGGRRRVLFVGGSLNQTTMVYAVAEQLPDHDRAFSPFFADGPFLQSMARAGLLDFTIMGGQARARSLGFLSGRDVAIDEGARRGPYDLVVTATDLLVPRALRRIPMLLIQEGMTDPEDWRYRLVRGLGLPRYLANTSMTGLSHGYRTFCVASEGYRELFIGKGVPADRMVVTGIPNFDHAAAHLQNAFPHRHYVLAATSCLRETMKPEDRPAFIRRCLEIADGRPLVFKLHPNEKVDRARREIERGAPRALVFAEGNTNHMIANCDALVTRYSSVVYVALALGKEVFADLPLDFLRRLMPVQNGGTSAARIAEECRRLLG